MFLLTLDGRDITTAFSIVVACLNNTGPGLGEVGTNFASLSATSKVISIVAMLLGRLEIFTFFLLITPGFWRR
jgi:trk system potassium uptake protein TrkH